MNKKGQCGLRVGSSARTAPTVMKATKPRLPLAGYSSPPARRKKGQRRRHPPPSPICISGIANRPTWSKPRSANQTGLLFTVFFYLPLAAPPLPPQTPVLKGLTSLCGSRSLSCTDLINNFYQPLAQEISRGWAVGGVCVCEGWGCALAAREGWGSGWWWWGGDSG